MTDPLSIAAGIIAVITATIQSSTALYQTVESFKNYPQRVQELLKQLRSLTEILASLRELSQQDESVAIPLEIPLKECGATCEQFRELLKLHRGSLSGGRKVSAWISFKFRNGDIVNFMETLAVYKSTIAIAIADANLRTSTVTLRVLNEYKTKVDTTAGHVQQHFEELLARLDELRAPATNERQQNARAPVYLEQILQEKSSVEHCLQICRRFQADIDQTQFKLVEARQFAGATSDMTLADMTTLSCLKACALEMAQAVSNLSKQATTTQRRLMEEPSSSHLGEEQLNGGDVDSVGEQHQANVGATQTQGIEDELASVKQLLHFCKDASSRATPDRVHVVEDITVGDDSHQVCVSTVGDLFRVNKAHAGNGAFQFFGSVAPEQLHEITTLHSRGRRTLVTEDAEDGELQAELHEQVRAGSAR